MFVGVVRHAGSTPMSNRFTERAMWPDPTDPQPLSDNDIQHITADVANGQPTTVWFTPAAVG